MLFLGKAWRPGAPKFRIKFDHSAIAAVQGKHAARWRGAIPCKWATAAGRLLCNDTKKPWQNPILPRPLFPCPICAQRRPRITKSSGSCSWARLGTCQNAPRGFLPSHGLPPTMAAFRRKAAQLQIQLRGKPRIPTGFLLSPPATQRSSKGDNDTMYAFISTKYHTGLQLSMPFSLPAAFSRCPPKNPHREEPPPAPGAEGGGGCGFWPAPG